MVDSNRSANYPALAALTSLFFMWGFITCLNDILIPHLKAVFTLNYTQAMLVQFCFFMAYLVMSPPSGFLVKRIGYQAGIVAGLCVAGTGCLLFYPAAGQQSYALFLTAFFVLASGITLLQVAANPYVTLLGAPDTASSRLTMTQAFNSLGTTLAPYFGAMLILSTAVKTPQQLQALTAAQLVQYHSSQAAAVQQPYLLLAGVLLAIAVIFSRLQLPKVNAIGQALAVPATNEVPHPSIWSYRHLLLGVLAIFLYVGGEVAIGSFLVNFLSQPDIAALTEQQAGQYVSLYWGGAMLGRFIGAVAMQKIASNKVLAVNAILASGLVAVTILSAGDIARWTILAVGLCNSVMFPAIFALALKDLGRHTEQGSGLLCAGIVGGAVIPVAQGLAADQLGIQQAFFMPLLCYLYIAYYGWRGSAVKVPGRGA